MKWVLALTLFITAAPMHAAAPVKPKTASKSVLSGHSSSHTVSARTTSSRTARGRYSKSNRRGRPAAPSYQLHPDPDRYQEIQKTLADKGYFKGDVNGTWGDDSVDAMKRFQADQKIEPDGKINALTLIGLGLGPKHGSESVTSSASPPPPHVSPVDPQ